MFVRKRFRRLQFNDKPTINNKISEVIPQTISIGIMHPQRFLRFNVEPSFLKAMFQAVLIHFLKIAIA